MTDWSARTKEVEAKFGLGDWFWRQINTESKFDPNAYNKKSGATGIAQIIPKFHPTVNARDPEASLQYAANWMRSMIASYTNAHKSNPTAYALAAYNWGPGNVAGWDGKKTSLPSETRTYLDTILGSDWSGGSVIPGLPSERPSWWPEGWDWPPLSNWMPGMPRLPEMPSADTLAGLIWDTFDGLRQRVRDKILENAKYWASIFGGPVAFWVVGQAFITFGLIGLAVAGIDAAKRSPTGRVALAGVTRGQSLIGGSGGGGGGSSPPASAPVVRMRRAPQRPAGQGATRPQGSLMRRAASDGAAVAGAVL